MFLLKSIIFVFILILVGFSLYHGHYNAAIFEVMIFILISLKNRYPNSKMLHSQYISQLILFNAKYIFILWTVITIMYYFNPDILKDLSSSSAIMPAIVMAMLIIFMSLTVILLVVNLLKYMYIKFFHRDAMYKEV